MVIRSHRTRFRNFPFPRRAARAIRNEPARGRAQSSLVPAGCHDARPLARLAGLRKKNPVSQRPLRGPACWIDRLMPRLRQRRLFCPFAPPRSWSCQSTRRSGSPAVRGSCRRTFRNPITSFPSKIAGARATPRGIAMARGTRSRMITPIAQAAGSIPTIKTSSRATIPSSVSTRFSISPAWRTSTLKGGRFPPRPRHSRARNGPFSGNFFGRPNSFFTLDFFSFSFDLFHGDAAFKPVDWRIKLTPTLGISNFSFSEVAQVSPNVLQGTVRTREVWALQEAFLEYKLADLGPDYDFVSVRAGTQPFNADFRGFLFADMNRGIRLFGSQFSNRDQFNLVYFRQWEKDTNTGLNTFNDRGQNLFFANYYRQDFIFPGYTAQVSLNYDNDPASLKYDKNRFLVRPDPDGDFQPHTVNVGYFGWAGDGHWGRYNLTHQFYWAFGYDSLNPLANRPQIIDAQMAAIEGSYDRDWVRFRLSFFWASGDGNINGTHATGFDTILDQPNFAGGGFSYWNRQQIPLQGVNLVQRLESGSRPSLEQDSRPGQLRQSRLDPSDLWHGLRRDAQDEADHQFQLAVVRQDERASSNSSFRETLIDSSGLTWASAASIGRS